MGDDDRACLFRALTVLLGDPGLIHSTDMLSHSCFQVQYQGIHYPLLTSTGTLAPDMNVIHRHICRQDTNKQNKITKQEKISLDEKIRYNMHICLFY